MKYPYQSDVPTDVRRSMAVLKEHKVLGESGELLMLYNGGYNIGFRCNTSKGVFDFIWSDPDWFSERDGDYQRWLALADTVSNSRVLGVKIVKGKEKPDALLPKRWYVRVSYTTVSHNTRAGKRTQVEAHFNDPAHRINSFVENLGDQP